MTHTTHGKSRTKLALGATIVLAAAPVPVFAQALADSANSSATVSAPAPVVVIPEAAPAATAQPRQSSRTVKAASARTTAPRQAAPATLVTAPVLATTPVISPAATSPAPAPVSAVPANPVGIDQPVAVTNPAPAPANDSTVPVGLLGALGLAAVAGAGVFALRRRRTHTETADEAYVTPTEPVALTPEPIAPAEARPLDLAAPVVASIPLVHASPLLDEDEPAPTGEARQELLDQMVAAEPDEANPFRSAQARRRRARLILQSHNARATDQAYAHATDPAFDWREWQAKDAAPTASASGSATSARVPEPVI